MARKSRFATPKEAEDWAVRAGAPLRGSGVPITSATRGPVRFWLTANGIPAAEGVTYPLALMSEAWHDTTGATVARLAKRAPAPTPAPMPERIDNPTTPAPAPIETRENNAMDPNYDAKLRALAEILTPSTPALDEGQVLDIMQRGMGDAIARATADATEAARASMADLVEEARSIVNGAPRALRIEIAGRVRDLPPAPRHPLFDTLLTLVACGRERGGLPVMLVGPAGSGKTTACQHVADAFGLPFFTNGALTGAHELTGYKDAAGHYHGTAFRRAFETGGVYLMDEMDRSDPGAILALNSALANGFMAFPDREEPVQAHPDFIPIVAANTYGRGADRLYVGATQLDGSTLDRFAVLAWDYDEALERTLAGDDPWTAYVQAARAAASELRVRHIISPRASMAGAVMRRAGLSFDLIAEAVLWKGLDREQRVRITDAIPERVARRAQAAVITTIAAE